MAKRRVDTKFVLVLGGILLVGGGIGGYFVVQSYLRDRDPVYLTRQAQLAETSGDVDMALGYYAKAWNRSTSDKEKLGMKAAELCYDNSDKDPKYYNGALTWWQRVIQENRNNLPAQQRLLKEVMELVPLRPAKDQSAAWADVEKKAGDIIKINDKEGTAYLFHGRAILRQASTSELNPERQAQARQDLEKAVKLLPDDADAITALMEFEMQRVAVLGNDKKALEAEKLRKQILATMTEFCNKHPKDSGGLLTLGRINLAFNHPEEGRKAIDQARQVNPTDPRVYNFLVFLTQRKNPQEAEGYLKKLVELDPKGIEAHYGLAKFYQDTRKVPQALEEYQGVLNLRGTGKGSQAARAEMMVADSLYQLCDLNMDLATDKGATTPEGKTALKQAAGFMEQVKGRRANDPALYRYQGRLLMLNGHLAEATEQLKKADTAFASDPNSPHWRNTKLYLAQAYEKLGDTGSALDYWTQVTQRYPQWVGPAFLRATLLFRMTRGTEARDQCLAILKVDPNNEATKRLLMSIYVSLGDTVGMKSVLPTLTQSDSAIAEIRMLLVNGESREALDLAKTVLEKDPEQQIVLSMAVSASLDLASKSTVKEDAEALRNDARKYVDQALAKNPNEQRLKILKVILNNPNADADELKKKVIEDVADPFERAVAQSFYHLGRKEYDKQIECLQQAEQIRPDSQEVVDRLFNAALNVRKWDLASRYAQKAEQLNVDGVNGRFFRGRLEVAKGNNEAGLKILKEATVSRPDFSMGWTVLGQAYLQIGQTREAKDALEHAVAQRPDNLPALKSLISICMAMGNDENIKAAQAYLVQARKFAPRDPELQSYDDLIGDPVQMIIRHERRRQENPEDWENLRRLAVGYVRKGEPAKAIEVLKPVQEKFPDDLSTADALARLYRDTQQPDMAFKLLEPFLASKDTKVQYAALLSVADLQRSLGQNTQAIKTFLTAVSKEPAGSTDANRRLADLYFDTEDLEHAEQLYKQIYDKEGGKDQRVALRWIETLIRQDKFNQAEDMLNNQVLKATPDNRQALVLKGYAQLRQRHPDLAINTFDRVLEKDPDNIDALHYRAFSRFFMQGDLELAITDLKRVRGIHENAVNSRLLLARVYRLNRNYAESAHEYQDVLNLRPDMTVARLEYADYLFSLAGAYLHMNANSNDIYSQVLRNIKPLEALQKLLDDSAKRFPDQPVWQILQGDLLNQLGNRQGALVMYRTVAEHEKWNPQASSPYLKVLLTEKAYDRVIEVTTKMLETNPQNMDLYVKRGSALGGQGKTPEALADFDKALDLATQNMDQFLNVVRQMFLSVPTDGAVSHLRARLTADPKNVAVRIGLAQVFITNQQNDEATTVLEPLLADKKFVLRPYVLQLSALARYQAQDFEHARQLYEELLSSRPDDLETLNNLAFMLADDLKRPADGLKYAEKAVKVLKSKDQAQVYVNNGNVMDTYGWVKFLAGDLSGAVTELNRALQTDPLPITYLHLGTVLQKQHKLGEARRILEEGRKLAQQKQDPMLPKIELALKDLK